MVVVVATRNIFCSHFPIYVLSNLFTIIILRVTSALYNFGRPRTFPSTYCEIGGMYM